MDMRYLRGLTFWKTGDADCLESVQNFFPMSRQYTIELLVLYYTTEPDNVFVSFMGDNGIWPSLIIGTDGDTVYMETTNRYDPAGVQRWQILNIPGNWEWRQFTLSLDYDETTGYTEYIGSVNGTTTQLSMST